MAKSIILSNGYSAFVDDADFDELNQWSWRWENGYAVRKDPTSKPRKTIYMHRVIMNAPTGVHVFHRDASSLNNQRDNLGLRSPNVPKPSRRIPRSQYIGVIWKKFAQRWMIKIKVNGKFKYLGFYVTEEEAAHGYDTAARYYFGDHAETNFPA